MKYLKEYIKEFSPYPDQIILKRFKHGIYYQGKIATIPIRYLDYFVLEHSDLTKWDKVIFIIVEDIGI